jgi:hypothetical protein
VKWTCLLSVLLCFAGSAAARNPVSAGANNVKANAVEEDWDFYPARVDDEPASIYLNLALARIAPKSAQPNMAYVRVKMRQPRPDGLSSDEEFGTLSAIEDALVEAVSTSGNSTFAGRNTSSGNRDFYFYTADPAAFALSVRKAMARVPAYQFEIGGRQDPKWTAYFEFLYPSADDLERIGSRRIRDNLASRGDDLSKPRKVQHLAYLPSVEKAEELRDHLLTQGFKVGEPEIEAGTVTLSFERTDAPERIDELVVAIARRVRELGGEYDGWGCEVTS